MSTPPKLPSIKSRFVGTVGWVLVVRASIASLLFGLGWSVLLGWIVRRLGSAPVRREFSAANALTVRHGNPT